jgi:outer membrane protein assembly factor BamB
MRTMLLGFLALCFLSSLAFCDDPVQTGKPRSIFAADYSKHIGALLREDNSEVWRIEIKDIHDVQQLPNGHWLLQTTFQNVVELDEKGKEVWRYEGGKNDKGENVEIHAFRRLENGLTMIAESGTRRILEVNAKKEIKRSIPLTVNNPNAHRDTRLVRPTNKGTYIVAHEGDQCVREYDGDGKVVWEYPVGSQLYSAVRLENGNTLIGTGNGHRVIEVSPDKQIVWQVAERELPGVQLAWITMVDRLPNGNTWIVNCHAGAENPQVVEVSPDKKVVWSFRDFDRFGNSLPVAIPLAP